MQESKISWDDYFLNLAVAVSKRGTCPRAQVGAVVVDKKNRVVAVGYNGAPSGRPECRDVGCDIVDNHCKRAIHAEENAITYALVALDKFNLKGCKLYTTMSVCEKCEAYAKRNGIEEFHYLIKYGDHL